METGKEIAILQLTPTEVVTLATEQARLLMDIVNRTNCFQLIAKKKYLQVEAWETIGAFNRTNAVTESVMPIKIGDEIVGYEAKVNLWKDGKMVGGAMMPCFLTENACKGKEGDAKYKASMSAAQTFATSKAYRMNFSYVAILAGYEPTPAEEISGEDTLGGVKSDTKLEHWCEVHKVNFFKKGGMKGYAHKIEGTNQWCNESEEKPEPTPDNADAKTSPATEQVERKPTKSKELPEFKTAPELFNYALGHGKSLEEIKAKTGYSSPTDVVDLKRAIKALYP